MIVVKALDDENDGNSLTREEYNISDRIGDFVYFSKSFVFRSDMSI